MSDQKSADHNPYSAPQTVTDDSPGNYRPAPANVAGVIFVILLILKYSGFWDWLGL